MSQYDELKTLKRELSAKRREDREQRLSLLEEIQDTLSAEFGCDPTVLDWVSLSESADRDLSSELSLKMVKFEDGECFACLRLTIGLDPSPPNYTIDFSVSRHAEGYEVIAHDTRFVVPDVPSDSRQSVVVSICDHIVTSIKNDLTERLKYYSS